MVQAGEKVVSVEDGLPTWVAELACNKGSTEEAIAFINQVLDSVKIPIIWMLNRALGVEEMYSSPSGEHDR